MSLLVPWSGGSVVGSGLVCASRCAFIHLCVCTQEKKKWENKITPSQAINDYLVK